MTFFQSFYDSAKALPDRERHAFYDAIIDYAFTGEQPTPDSPAYALFLLAKPNIDKSRENAENGRKGGLKCGAVKARFGNSNARGLALRSQAKRKGACVSNASDKEKDKEKDKDITYPTPTPSGGGGGAEGENAVEVSEMEQQILSSVRVSALNVTPAGVVTVGFTDSSVQPPRNYFMEVGEKRGEWTVSEADTNPEKKTVKLSKNGVEATLKLGGNSPQEGGKSAVASPNGKPALSGRPGVRMPMRHAGRMGQPGSVDDGAATDGQKLTGLQLARARQEKRRLEMEAEAAQRRQAFELAKKEAEERKAQSAELAKIREELRRQREERMAEEEARRATAGEAEQP